MTRSARTPPRPPDAAGRAREASILLATVLDLGILLPYTAAGIWADSLTTIAECLRAWLMLAAEIVLLVVLRRIQRGQLAGYDYGVGKLEQFSNLLIGTTMIGLGLWLGISAAERWWAPPAHRGEGLLVAAVLAVVNLGLNAYALHALWRAGADGTSAIMAAQIRSRAVKVFSSAVVAVAIAVNALDHHQEDQDIHGLIAEVFGTAFVAIVMVQLGIGLWRQAMPQLLDRTLDESGQAAINRALAAHFIGYDALLGVRSRLSGKEARVDIALGFAPHRRMDDVQAVADSVAATVRERIPGALVTVTPVSIGGAPPDA